MFSWFRIPNIIPVSANEVRQYYRKLLLKELLKAMEPRPVSKQHHTNYIPIFPGLVSCIVPKIPYSFLLSEDEVLDFFGQCVIVDKHPEDPYSTVHELSFPVTLEHSSKHGGIRVNFFYFCSTKLQPGLQKFW